MIHTTSIDNLPQPIKKHPPLVQTNKDRILINLEKKLYTPGEKVQGMVYLEHSTNKSIPFD